MIRKIDITKTYIEDQEEFLKSLQTAVKNGLMAPAGIILDDEPEVKRRAHMIVNAIRDKFTEVDAILVLPGTLIQVLFPKKELLVTIMFLQNKMTGDKNIRLELCKLTSEDILHLELIWGTPINFRS